MDEAKQTNSLILQQASVMAAEGSDETPLIFATQTAATIADLDIEGLNLEEPAISSVGSDVTMSTNVGRTISSPEKTQTATGVTTSPFILMVSEQKQTKMLSKTSDREKLSPAEMELTVPYVDCTQHDMPFINFMIPLNPPVRVSTVYAGHTALLSERNHQMCLVKLANMLELYGTEIFAVDKVTGEMYTVIDGMVSKIDLQAYLDEEVEDVQGVIKFAPTHTSTSRDVEMPSRIHSQSGKLSELSAIEE